MNINLAPKDEEYLKSKVDEGYYVNMAEAIRDAVRRMCEADAGRDEFVEAVMKGARQLDEGKKTPYTPGLIEQIRQPASERSVNGRKPNPNVIPQ